MGDGSSNDRSGVAPERDALATFENDYYFFTKIVTRLCKILGTTSLRSRITLSLATFGSIAFGIPIIFGLATGDMLFDSWEIVLGSLALALSALLIDAFEFAIDSFSDRFRDKLSSDHERDAFDEMKLRLLKSKNYLVYALVFYLALLALIGGMLAEHTLLTIIMVAVLAIPMVLAWGIGIHVTVSMYGFMRRICIMDVSVDVFDPDGFGGFGTIGKLSIRVSLFISSGSLYIPFFFDRLRTFQLPYIALTSALAIGAIMMVILLTFLTTVLPVHRLARDARERLLGSLGSRLRQRLGGFESGTTSELERDLEVLLALESYREVKELRVWPFNPETVIAVMGMVMLPVALFLLGIFLRF